MSPEMRSASWGATVGASVGNGDMSIFQTENQVPISANGQRLSANSFQIDGVSVNSQTWGGAAVVTPSQEAVKEVQVTSSTYSAEDGRNSRANGLVYSLAVVAGRRLTDRDGMCPMHRDRRCADLTWP